jgi:hypothetical protein
METQDTAVLSATSAQITFLEKLGIKDFSGDRGAASAEITRLLAMRSNPPASKAQMGKLAALGGKDMPGAGVREASTAISVLELLDQIGDNFELVGEEADYEIAAINNLLSYLRTRFVK